MKSSIESTRLQENVVRQAKRLRRKLDIPLEVAKLILARAAYHCSSWDRLMAKLEVREAMERELILAHLPNSDEGRAYLARNLRQISRAIGNRNLTNRNLAGVCEVVRQVFEVSDDPIALSDITESVGEINWRPAGIGPDASAVIEAECKLNGEWIKLIGTRVYLPEHLPFDEHLRAYAKCAGLPGKTFEIAWTHLDGWYKAAVEYLALADDEENWDAEPDFPVVDLDVPMRGHNKWFQDLLSYWRDRAMYDCEEELAFQPLVREEGCYLVFGFPYVPSNTRASASGCRIERDKNDDKSNGQVILIGGQPHVLHWCGAPNIDGDSRPLSAMYGGAVRHPLFSAPSAAGSKPIATTYFVRPVSPVDIQQMMKLELRADPGKEVWALQTDDFAMAEAILAKISARDIYRYDSETKGTVYCLALNAANFDTCDGAHMSLTVANDEDFFTSSLITSSVSILDEQAQRRLHVVLSQHLLSLVDLIGHKNLCKAIKHGLAIDKTDGFQRSTTRLPNWCSTLPIAPKEIIEVLEDRKWDITIRSIFDLFRHATRIKYTRENY